MQLGGMHVPKYADVNLAGQDIQREEFEMAPSAHLELGSRQPVPKISSFGHGLITE